MKKTIAEIKRKFLKQKDLIIVFIWVLIYYPVCSISPIPMLLIFIGILDFLCNKYIDNYNKIFKNQKEEFFIPIFERIFCFFPYFLMLFTLANTILIFIMEYPNMRNMQDLMDLVILPMVDTQKSGIGRLFGIEGLFSFYFSFYYIGRDKDKFSYFIRYNHVLSLLIGQTLNFIFALINILKKYGGVDVIPLCQSLTLTLCLIFFLFICFALIQTSLGKQPILPFFDLATQYQVGIREREDESVIDISDEEE